MDARHGWSTCRRIRCNRRYHPGPHTFTCVTRSTRISCSLSPHDEVVNGQRSLINKMAGDHWQQFATLRLLWLQWALPPKLLFKGDDIGTAQRMGSTRARSSGSSCNIPSTKACGADRHLNRCPCARRALHDVTSSPRASSGRRRRCGAQRNGILFLRIARRRIHVSSCATSPPVLRDR